MSGGRKRHEEHEDKVFDRWCLRQSRARFLVVVLHPTSPLLRHRTELLHTAIDARDCRGLAEFYRELLGLAYRDGDEPPRDGTLDDADWLVLIDDRGRRVIAVQQKHDTVPPTWPSEDVPMQLHLDFTVATAVDLERHRRRAEAFGARILHDRSDDEVEPLYVLADPAGHPFCLLVR